ncbi:MAG: CDP-glucose 4,6-dehydratase [Gemmataceae bacterium]
MWASWDEPLVHQVVHEHQPEVIFHLAAQPLVRLSYRIPVETFAVNVVGTANVLEAARHTPSVRAVVVVTSDKCYANREWHWGYREDEPMGGHDPYSASKGCAELVAAAYRTSYGKAPGAPAIATVRAGNVIGGGDWAEDRLVPDLIRGLIDRQPIIIRRPGAIRPWQHVLEPLSGYLLVGASLLEEGERWGQGWNFGPFELDPMPVGTLARRLVDLWGSGDLRIEREMTGPHEAHFLKLDSSKALNELGWRPMLNPEERLAWTVEWYQQCQADPAGSWAQTRRQIQTYQQRMLLQEGFGPGWMRGVESRRAA